MDSQGIHSGRNQVNEQCGDHSFEEETGREKETPMSKIW